MNSRHPIFCLLMALLGSSLGISSAVAAVDRERSQSFYENALQYFRTDGVSEAIIELRNALQTDPDNLPARILLGEALLRDDQPRAAIEEFQFALSRGGDENLIFVPLATAYLEILKPEQVITAITTSGHDPEVDGALHYLQGRAYLLLKNPKLAEKSFITATSLNPLDVRPVIERARLALGQRNRAKAEKFITQALGSNPDAFELWQFKALLHRDVGEYEQAFSAFEQALKLRPTSGDALAARAALWLDVGNVEAATADLTKARELESDTLETIYLRTLLLYREGKVEEAKEVLVESAAQINSIVDDYRSMLPQTKLMLGIVAFFQGNYNEAVSHLEPFVKSVPGHLGAKRYLGAVYGSLGEWDKVLKLFGRRLSAEVPADPMVLSLLAEAHRAKGQYAKAQTYYEEASKLAPDAAGVGLRLAMVRLEAGDPDKALEELTWLVEKVPDLLEAKIQLALLYLRVGQRDSALEAAHELASVHGYNPQAVNAAATIYLALNDPTQARVLFQSASMLDPNYVLPKLNIARLEKSLGNAASAESEYRTILQNHPHNVEAGLELARLLSEDGAFTEANEIIDQVLEDAPENFDAYVLMLQILQGRRAPEERIANAAYDLTEKFPEEPKAEIIAARVSESQNEREDARMRYRRAVEKAGFNSGVLVAIAEEQIKILDYTGAMWTLTLALQSNPGSLSAGVLKVGVYTNLKEFEKAGAMVEELFVQHGEKAPLFSVRGGLRVAEGDVRGAIENFQRAYDLNPTQYNVQSLFRALVRDGRLSDGVELMKDWASANPGDFASRLLLGEVLMNNGRFAESRDVYEGLRRDGVTHVAVLNNLAVIYQHLGDGRALALAKLAFDQAPESASVLDTYGWIVTESGNATEGLAILREAYARSSTVPEIRYHIGLALLRLGKTDEARVELAASIEQSLSFLGRDHAEETLRNLATGRAVN
tara:strand:+ start:1360 stop:4194 length:2835 start_codon:yes stop_codon:yes gene_type:complete